MRIMNLFEVAYVDQGKPIFFLRHCWRGAERKSRATLVEKERKFSEFLVARAREGCQ